MAAFDEMVDGRGGVRPHWRGVLGVLAALDPQHMQVRADRLHRTAEEEGAAPSWRCDPVPLPLPAPEFAELEEGLCQRARLLELLLADLYGPQDTVRGGALPAALMYPNPGFLRSCRGAAPAGGRFLQAYAADLVRGPDGQWRVLADLTGGCMGIGYAREARRLLARVVPELFRPAQVRQLRPFFEAWQDALLDAAPAPGRQPSVALLTPGVLDPHWPEHLALSRDLNCALVQARDLTARGGALFLKTLSGLQPVDVLLRRVPGASLDPLESPAGAAGPGVTGLLDAARAGAVRILNHPGAAAVEAPGLAAFLPALCRRLLHEPLRLPTTPTVWLGDDASRRMACQAFTRWSIRPALDPHPAPQTLHAMAPDARGALEAVIAARPWDYAGVTVAPPSVAPCHGASGLDARPVVLRMFLMHDGVRWRVMPGGLARILNEGQHAVEGLPAGALFKDVWVLSQDNASLHGPEPVRQAPVPIRRSAGNLPSRVADDFYWLGRHVERLDMQARLGRAALLRRARGAPLPREVAELQVLTDCLAEAGLDEAERRGPPDHLLRGAAAPGGALADGLEAASSLVEALRDRLTVETYGAFSQALRAARADLRAGADVDSLVHGMTGLQRLSNTVAGVAAEGMVRNGGWLFLDLGRRIERLLGSTATLALLLRQPTDRAEGTMRLVLELFDSAITYRSRYLSVLQAAPVLDLVMADGGNPRSLAYQLEQAGRLLDQADASGPVLSGMADAMALRVSAMVSRVARAAAPEREMSALPDALETLAADAAALSDRITRQFFALLPPLQEVGLEVA